MWGVQARRKVRKSRAASGFDGGGCRDAWSQHRRISRRCHWEILLSRLWNCFRLTIFFLFFFSIIFVYGERWLVWFIRNDIFFCFISDTDSFGWHVDRVEFLIGWFPYLQSTFEVSITLGLGLRLRVRGWILYGCFVFCFLLLDERLVG